MSMESLVTGVLDLADELPKLPRPMLIGGGFGLYLKQRHLEEQGDIDTLIPGELWPPARATEDVDLLVPTEVIINVEHMQSIRDALDRLGYVPDVDFFQFVKHTPKGPVKIDLLTCDIPPEHRSKVKMSLPRVRPVGKVELHAYLAKEALALGLSPFELSLSGTRSDGESVELGVSIPNSFTYLLMKMHAFRDRVNDAQKNLASHHALDLYRITAMLTREEYDLVKALSETYADSEPVLAAAQIVQEYFGRSGSLGIVRLQAGAMNSGVRNADLETETFLEVLAELFPTQRPRQ